MPDIENEDTLATRAAIGNVRDEIARAILNPVSYDRTIFDMGRRAILISYMAFLLLVIVTLLPPLFSAILHQEIQIGFIPKNENSTPFVQILSAYLIQILIFATSLISLFVGYRLIIASGASPDQVIPPQDYQLLAPLVAEGKSESVDIYVKLSSLRGVTGFFTKLGLTGLPLATIALTLIFSILALFQSSNGAFLDLAKLTLGAFIGSFVQRQVERRNEPSPRNQVTVAPPS